MRLLILLLIINSCTSAGNKNAEKIIGSAHSVAFQDTVVKKSLQAIPSLEINTAEIKVLLKQVPVSLEKGLNFTLNIPINYQLSVAAQGLKRLRFLALSPDNRLFATDLYDRSDNHKGRVLIFENWNDSAKHFDKITTWLDSLHNPNQVAFYKNFIYVAETGRLSRFLYHAGDSIPSDAGKVVAVFPENGLSYKYGGWHLTRSLAFHHDKLYVSVGSSCNACVESEENRATIIEMEPDGSNAQFFARGIRNAVGIKWIGDELWVTGMGRDLIGPDKPEDVFQKIEKNGYYGWPYYFQYRQKIYADKEFKDAAKPAWVKEPAVAFCGFKAHSAPLGFEYLENFDDSLLKNSVLVCLHGSTSVWRERGNAVVKVGKGNNYTEIVSGFLTGKTEEGRHGRPCDVLMKNEQSFFITDDLHGVLYYLWKD